MGFTKEGSVKGLFSSRRIFITIFLILAVVLVACERQIQEEEPVPTPAAPVLTPPALPTTDPLLVPTTDPALIPTTDPALIPTTDPAAPPADPNAQATPAATSPVTHVVGAGETLFTIASQYGITLEQLAAANNDDPNGLLAVGQTIIVPVAGTTTAPPTVVAPPVTNAGEQIHIVSAGENLFRIGLRYGFTVAELAAYNNIPNPDRISVGQQIRIPPGGNQQ
jgi:LysM repeat protein